MKYEVEVIRYYAAASRTVRQFDKWEDVPKYLASLAVIPSSVHIKVVPA